MIRRGVSFLYCLFLMLLSSGVLAPRGLILENNIGKNMHNTHLAPKIKSLVEGKAKELGVSFNNVKVAPIQLNRGAHTLVNGTLLVKMDNSNISLEVGDLTRYSDKQLEVMAEHEACHCKDIQDGFYSSNIFTTRNPFIEMATLEMHMCYTDYLASKRQIVVFGQDHFETCQVAGLADYVRQNESIISRAPDQDSKAIAVYAYCKEQVKCGLMRADPKILPRVIKDIVAPYKECFDRVHTSGFTWADKTKVLFNMLAVTLRGVGLPESHSQSRLVLRQPLQNNTSIRSQEQGVLNPFSFSLAMGLEDIMLNTYRSLASSQASAGNKK